MFGRTLGGMHAATLALPDLTTQARRLVELGLGRLAGLPDSAIHDAVASVEVDDALLVPGPALVTPSALAPLVNRADKPGFVVVDMTDLDQFGPIPGVDLPDTPFYLISGLDRGDEMANWSPDEALPAITGAGRTPLTVSEGIAWLLQQPDRLEPNHCFMTIGSRLRKPNGRLDSRTPAIWISGGTGRDGRERKGAPKVGWCWAGNRHTWLGFASAAQRRSL
ncbi:DUF5701 family protein [Gordonia sp. Z-3]|uniref:DUF5701 family protein n=2 Tax=Gordonia TaxID=2053 RepID=A0A9X3D910_9ACTN|nr:DUF5701 family protein [Gordonia aquimaris]MCX2966932.1 DUF5701 family protein [Gordonia aquimaris]MED5803163.1 DUF5701 family protein [Gordonia sp. Z-3]